MDTETVKISNYSEDEKTCDAERSSAFFGIIEALLYVSGEPVSIDELQRVFDISAPEIRKSISQMAEEMKKAGRGMIPYMTENTVQFVTNSEYNEWVVKLLSPPEERTMSDSLLETLSVIAYRQPVTRADIESVRGVRCEYSVTQLLKQGLIVELGRKDCIGRPMQFGTTDAFLRKFGLSSLRDLPPLPIREDDESAQVDDRMPLADTSNQADFADNGGE